MSAISILTTTVGIFGLLITVFLAFFQVKNPVKISKKDTIFIGVWLFLCILGCVNIYYAKRVSNEKVSNQQDDDYINVKMNSQDDNEGNKQNNKDKTENKNSNDDIDNKGNNNLSEEEILIVENNDLIQELKNFNKSTKIFHSKSIELSFSETAGYIYSDIQKNGKFEKLGGERVTPSKVIVLDYYSDEIIYTFNSQENNCIEYFPNNTDKFYCIIYHEKYNLYVTQPIQVVGGDSYGSMHILLNKESDKYTPLFQLHAYMRDLHIDENYSTCSSDYGVLMQCKNIYSDKGNITLFTDILDSGIISYCGCSYISLNSNYIVDLFLYEESHGDSILSNTTLDKVVTDSNVIKIYFDIINEPNTNG